MKSMIAAVVGIAFVGAVCAEDKSKQKPEVKFFDVLATTSGSATASKDDTVLIGVQQSSALEKLVSKVVVTVDGKIVKKPETTFFGAIGGGYLCYVHRPEKSGKVTISVTPVYRADKQGEAGRGGTGADGCLQETRIGRCDMND